MRKTKKVGAVLTRRSHKSTRARNGKEDKTESLASVLENMRKTKRGGDDLTRRSHKSTSPLYRREDISPLYSRKEMKERLTSVLENMWETKRDHDDLTRRSNKIRRVRDDEEEKNESLTSDMLGTKRGGDYLTTRSKRIRRARDGGEEKNESFTSGDLSRGFYQDAWTRLSDEVKSNLARSVASLALCYGDTVLFACSGIAIECQEHLTRFLTSASLSTAFSDTENDHDNFRIEVRHEGKMYQGLLAEYDLALNFAVVSIKTFLDVNVVVKHGVEILPHGNVLALGRDISGKLMTTNVIPAGDSEDNEGCICKISEVWEGGALFTCDGNFIGMNLFLDMEKSYFASWGSILKWLECSSPHKKTGLPQSENLKGIRFGARRICETSNNHLVCVLSVVQIQDLISMGYPEPPMVLDDHMVLVDTFEEIFGDIYPKGVWRELSIKAASNIDRYVVALASFNGDKRSIACTGFFIEWNGSTTILTSASLVRSSSDENMIDENLRIEVLLPSKRRTEGTLQHYSLHYNVALVSVKDCRVVRPAIVHPCRFGWSEVAAVGRCFESGALMAMVGDPVPWSGTLDCLYIVRTTCKITKAGIGGPLVNLDGEVLGMNFYDTRIGTPFLLWSDIDNILARFREKSNAGEVGSDSVPSGAAFWKMDGDYSDRLNRWPVPMPCWRHHADVDKDKSVDELVAFDPKTGCKKRYGYVLGEKIELY